MVPQKINNMILILGKNGYVGKKFSLNLSETIHQCLGRDDLDYYDSSLLRDFVKTRKSAF